MRKYLKYLLPYWWQIIFLFVGLILQVWSSLQLPDVMSQIINQGIVNSNLDFIYSEGTWMLLVALVGGVGTVISGFFASRIGAGFAKRVREDIYQKIMQFSFAEIDNFSTASLITRTTNDVFQVQQGTTMVLRMCLQAPLMGIGAVLKAFETAPGMTWIIALAVGVLFTVIITVLILALPKFNLLQKLLDKLNHVMRENLTGLRVIRAFNNEKVSEEKFSDANVDLTKTSLFVNRVMSIVFPTVQLLLNLTTLMIVWVGATYVDNGIIEVGNVMAFIQYAMQVMMSFMLLTMAFIVVPRAMVSWRRINEVFKTENSIIPSENPQRINKKNRGMVEFKDANFTYPGAEDSVLKNISFKMEPGQTTAVIGSTGSGKSTLINLIPRFYDVTKGAVLVDGVDVRDLDQEDLMKRIGYIPQKNRLFSGTIESNIAFGLPINQKQLRKSTKIAQASEFINRLPKKFKSPVDQNGANLSGGQKQRLSIARAIYKEPEIYIFDDSFSALDFKTERSLHEALKKNLSDASVMIVAQRVGTIKQADQIIVLDKGRQVGTGTHYELLRNNEVYREIAESQLSEDEMKTELEQARKDKYGK